MVAEGDLARHADCRLATQGIYVVQRLQCIYGARVCASCVLSVQVRARKREVDGNKPKEEARRRSRRPVKRDYAHVKEVIILERIRATYQCGIRVV